MNIVHYLSASGDYFIEVGEHIPSEGCIIVTERPSRNYIYDRDKNDWVLDLEPVKALQWEKIKKERSEKINADIIVHDVPWQCRPIDMDNIKEALLLSNLPVPPNQVWRDANNVSHPFTSWQYLMDIHLAWAMRKSKIYTDSWIVEQEIKDARTQKELDEITWPG